MTEQASEMPPSGSTGLGLWTAGRAARSLGGTIRRESTETGTTLVLDIPIRPAAGQDIPAARPHVELAHG